MTDETPIQFSEDGHELLRQLVVAVQSINAGLQSIDARLTALETKVDERLHDTRPMWESLSSQLMEFRSEMQTAVRDLDRSISNFQFDVLRRQRDFDERLRNIEGK